MSAQATFDYAASLDEAGLSPEKVEEGFVRALEQDPSHLEWHTRYILFLVTRARTAEAQEHWKRVKNMIAKGSFATNDVYETLYKPVARYLIEDFSFDWAQELLAEVSVDDREWAALRHYYSILSGDRILSQYIPIWYLYDRWWEDGPLRVPTSRNSRPLRMRLCGHASSMDHEVWLHAVQLVPGESPVEVSFSLSFDQFLQSLDTLGVEEGRFVELGVYGEGDDTIFHISAFPEGMPAWAPEQHLPLVWPDPMRYVQAYKHNPEYLEAT